MIATLNTCEEGDAFTRMAVHEAGGDVYGGKKDVVWASDDKIRVFTLDKLSQDIYELESGAGTAEGTFVRTQETGLIGDKYAITEADMVYGVSAAEIDGEILPRLTLTLPREYTPGKNAEGNQKFPIPYWGAAEVTEDAESATLNTKLSGMTAYLRINIGELPAGTKKIVLTTHGGGIFKPEEGFLLASKAPDQDTKKGWYGDDYPNALPANTQWIVGGASEALSGTLNTILEKGCELAIDERLVHSDEMIITLPNVKNQTIYVPIVCGYYKNLYVIAATAVSENYKYCYAGKMLKVFQDQKFIRNKAYYLNLQLANFDKICIGGLNKAIAELNTTEGMTTIINVGELVYDYATDAKHDVKGGHLGYSDDEIYFDGPGNVILNLNKVGDNDGMGVYDDPLKIIDIFDDTDVVPQDAKGINRFLEVNLPNGMNNDENAYYLINELGVGENPLSDIYLGTIDGVQADKVSIRVKGSKTKFTQYENISTLRPHQKILPEKTAAINIKNGFKYIEILPGSGDVYTYTDGRQAQEETEIDIFKVSARGKEGFRFDDALIGNLWFAATDADDRVVMTTGSTAFKKISTDTDGADWNEAFDGNTFDASVAKPRPSSMTPSNVQIYAFWTGKALTAYAIENEYDVQEVWTAAQLASMGEGVYPDGWDSDLPLMIDESNHQTTSDYTGLEDIAEIEKLEDFLNAGTKPKIHEYWIPKDLVSLIWLGDDIYPWIGPRVRVDEFKLHGEMTELKNMNFLAEWFNGLDFKADDPHWCCTSCWTPNVTPKYVNLENYVGLMRFIVSPTSALVEQVNLNEVEIVTPFKRSKREGVDLSDINFIGSIAGAIASKQITFEYNKAAELKIATYGDFVGGMVGAFINYGGTLIIRDNQSIGKAKNFDGEVIGGNNVGGLAGFIYTAGGVSHIKRNWVQMDYLLHAIENAVGGLAGTLLNADNNAEVDDNTVEIGKDSHSGLIYAGNKLAGGLIGFAKLQDETKTLFMRSADVYVSGKIQADNGYVGGEVGRSYAGKVMVGVPLDVIPNITRDWATNINIGTLAGKFAVGGLVGNNAQSNKSPMWVVTGQTAGKNPKKVSANIAINEFVNTKTAADFGVGEQQYFGTMSNILGYMQADIHVYEDNLTVADNLQSEMKEAVLYKEHPDNTHNVHIDQKYWGDGNGYVGYGSNGTYYLNGLTPLNIVPGEIIDPSDIISYNVFKTPTRYSETSKHVNN